MTDRPSRQAPLHVLVIGSTGPLGRAVLRHADPAQVQLRAFARRPEALADEASAAPSFETVQGDVRDRASLVRALAGVDAVISVLGSKPWHRDAKGVYEEGTANLIAAMRETDVERVVVVTGVGAGDSRGHGPLWYEWLMRPTLLRSAYEDKERQEALLKESSLDWTIVRPGVLVATSPDKQIKAMRTLGPGQKLGSISRDDVARFLLSEVVDPQHSEHVVHLAT